MAIVPAHHTKTRAKYKWAMKKKMNLAVKLVRALHLAAPTLDHLGDQHAFARRLYDWFAKRILPDAVKKSPVCADHFKSGLKYNLRTVRARFGTEWAAAKEQAVREGKEAPPNPLQHKSEKTTYRSYVKVEDSDFEDDEEDEPET